MGDRIEARADHLIECAGVVEPTWRYLSLRLTIDGQMVIFIHRVSRFRHWTAAQSRCGRRPRGGANVPDPHLANVGVHLPLTYVSLPPRGAPIDQRGAG